MKKILILFLFIPLFSCNDWLNVEPEDSVTFVNYFKSEEELKALHNGIASYMKNICIGKQPYFYNALAAPLPYKSIEGMTEIDKVVVVDQSPLGKSPRSNPATYTGLFTDIRKIFEKLPESQIRGYTAGRFSFNVSGGRCEVCKGAGVKTIEMNFLPDVYVHCEACDGKRYNKETLEVRYKGKSIGDVLNLTINQAVEFFENLPHLQSKLKMLQDVGLGYIKIGQPCTTLSGGESQRIKLATELSKKDM